MPGHLQELRSGRRRLGEQLQPVVDGPDRAAPAPTGVAELEQLVGGVGQRVHVDPVDPGEAEPRSPSDPGEPEGIAAPDLWPSAGGFAGGEDGVELAAPSWASCEGVGSGVMPAHAPESCSSWPIAVRLT